MNRIDKVNVAHRIAVADELISVSDSKIKEISNEPTSALEMLLAARKSLDEAIKIVRRGEQDAEAFRDFAQTKKMIESVLANLIPGGDPDA